jgi:predicted RNA-binding protein YlxR (DUF448 family)
VSAPIRTCIGCRGRADKADLLRIVWGAEPRRDADGGPVVDATQTAPGRGAYLHHSADCLQLAVKRRAAGRALRVAGVDPAALTAAVEGHLGG